MHPLVPVIGLISFAWCIIALIAAIFPGRRKLRLKHAGVAFAVFVGTLIYAGDPKHRDRGAPRVTIAGDSAEASTPSKPKTEPTPPISETYRREIDQAASEVSAFSAKNLASSVDDIGRALATMQHWADVYGRGKSMQLDPATAKARDQFLKQAKAKQAASLPILRDQYGPIMRKTLWIDDGGAKTVGTGYRTVKFYHWSFAANRRIQEAYTASYQMLKQLRFTRAEYRWIDSEYGEYTYYTIDAPSDGTLGRWRGSQFLSVE